ncbi:MAG: hypothetical protein ACP5JG_00335 [Anaerolineae bacterium]
MRKEHSRVLITLSTLAALLTLVAAAGGLFWPAKGESFTFTTIHGLTVEIYGRGLYRNESAFKAPVLRGADAILLFIGIPLLVVALMLYQRGSLRGRLLLTGILSCFLYNAASLAFGAAYNELFLVYLASFSASLYAFVLALTSIDLDDLPSRVLPGMPHRALAIFIFIAGLSPTVWLIEIVAGLIAGHVPSGLAHYTTDVTAVLDVGIILPASFLAGILLLRRKSLGYPLASTILILLTLIGLIVASQTVMQILDGIVLSAGQFAAFVVPFVSLSLIAVGLTISLLRHISEP